MRENFERNQEQPFQYVVVYKRKDNNAILGYHASTFCELTQNKLYGKRYNGTDYEPQLDVIRDNLKSIINTTHDDNSMLGELKYAVKKKLYSNLKFEDICLEVEYLSEDVEKQEFNFNRIQ